MGGGNGFALLHRQDGLFTIQEALKRPLRISFERDASGNIISLIALQDYQNPGLLPNTRSYSPKNLVFVLIQAFVFNKQ